MRYDLAIQYATNSSTHEQCYERLTWDETAERIKAWRPTSGHHIKGTVTYRVSVSSNKADTNSGA